MPTQGLGSHGTLQVRFMCGDKRLRRSFTNKSSHESQNFTGSRGAGGVQLLFSSQRSLEELC